MRFFTPTVYHRYRRYYTNLRRFYQRPQVKAYTFLILSLLTASFFGFFAIRPTVKTIGELIKEIKDKREAVEKMEEKINALSLAQREYALVKEDLPIVYQVLPPKPEAVQLAKEIESLARKNGLVISSLTFGEISLFPQEKKEKIPLFFSANFQGSYKDFKSFLNDLENLRRIIILEKLSLEKPEKPPLSLKIEAKAFYLKKE